MRPPLPSPRFRRAQSGAFLLEALVGVLALDQPVCLHPLQQELLHGLSGVQAAERVLEDHLHVVAATSQRLALEGGQVGAVEAQVLEREPVTGGGMLHAGHCTRIPGRRRAAPMLGAGPSVCCGVHQAPNSAPKSPSSRRAFTKERKRAASAPSTRRWS